MHGATRPLAETLASLHQQIIQLRKHITDEQTAAANTAAGTIARANTEAHRIITEAITAADTIRAQTDRAAATARALAENEANLIRERAYLEGRARADEHRITHDNQTAGNRRRQQLEHHLRR